MTSLARKQLLVVPTWTVVWMMHAGLVRRRDQLEELAEARQMAAELTGRCLVWVLQDINYEPVAHWHALPREEDPVTGDFVHYLAGPYAPRVGLVTSRRSVKLWAEGRTVSHRYSRRVVLLRWRASEVEHR